MQCRFVSQENIERYRKLASESTDTTERSQIMKLLAEEEAKLKLEPRRGATLAKEIARQRGNRESGRG